MEHEVTFPGWVSNRIAFGLALFGNAAAWVQSYLVANVSIGGVVTFCTVAFPALCGACVYFLKNTWPVIEDRYFAHVERRERIRSTSLAGQIAQLNANLVEERRAREAAASLAEVQAKLAAGARDLAERNAAHVAVLTEAVRDLTAKLDEANRGIALANEQAEKARASLHQLRNESNAALMAAQADNAELRKKLDEAKGELHRVGEQLSQIRAQVAPRAQVDDNTARLDQLEAEVRQGPFSNSGD